MEYGYAVRKEPQYARWIGLGVRFFLSASLTAALTVGGYAPFALGCIAASGAGMEGVSAFLGGLSGALLLLPFSGLLPFAAAGILIVTASAAFRSAPFWSRRAVMPLCAAAMTLAVGAVTVLRAASQEALVSCLAAAGLTGAAAWFFRDFFETKRDRADGNGTLFL
ncbi:MAG: stage II sporulation protein E, partial [Oscillibacter sp.]|nr:stage II sporulation protein E [Oscillibacter sp.]